MLILVCHSSVSNVPYFHFEYFELTKEDHFHESFWTEKKRNARQASESSNRSILIDINRRTSEIRPE